MNIEHLKDNRTDIAVISSDEKLIVDTQSALDLAMTVKYETGTIYQLSCQNCHLWRLLTVYKQAIYQAGTWTDKNGGSDFAFNGIRSVIFAAYTLTIRRKI